MILTICIKKMVTRLRHQGFRLRQGFGGQVCGQAGTIFLMNE
jgi:hypothetical protein